MGGVASGLVTCPLDVIKTKLQAQGAWHSQRSSIPGQPRVVYQGMAGTARVIWTEEGVRGMYRGLTPMILGYLPTWAVWFTVYERAKGFWYQRVGQETEGEKFLAHLLASLSAGATSTMVTNPIWVIKTRLMSQTSLRSASEIKAPWHYTSTWDAARKMYQTEGLRSFYSGLTPALLGLTHVAVQFPLYEYFKMKFTGRPMGYRAVEGEESYWLGTLAAGTLSKVCASTATYPHEVLRTRLQTQQRTYPVASQEEIAFRGGLKSAGDQGRPSPGVSSTDGMRSPLRYRGIVPTFTTILREEGWRAFYAGMGTNLIRAVPAAVTTLLTYEYTLGRVGALRESAFQKLGTGNPDK
ncbi:MAG: hypothetical protein M1814_004625 [Vezdaea aestivalis]|nr:MAG: hypothetical protein M1814_004625 [Vezdaea aestivalis]